MSGLDRAVRGGLGVLGLALGLYGGYLMLSRQRGEQVLGAVRWFVGGVVLHDVVLAGVVTLGGLAVARVLPRAVRAPVAVVAIVLGPVTLAAVPVLLSYGAKADNPTLLDRDYALGWLALAAVVVAAVMTVAVALMPRQAVSDR